mgnify:FL=1|jgi:hypothetical protein|tara:strand:- start:353 stop:703 length:351 start_codon:yes stop_codon:yes gene_type:complete
MEEKNFTKNDIPFFKDELKTAEKEYSKDIEETMHKSLTGDRFEKRVKRLKKIIKLLNSGIFFKEYNPPSLIIVKDKFIISLIKNIWRIKGRQVWYRHTENLNSFKENYIEKDFKKI